MKQWKEELIAKVELHGGLYLANKVREGLKRVKKQGITDENTNNLLDYFSWRADKGFNTTEESVEFWISIFITFGGVND